MTIATTIDLLPRDLLAAPAAGSSNGRIVELGTHPLLVTARRTKLLEAMKVARRVAKFRKVNLSMRIQESSVERDVYATTKRRNKLVRTFVRREVVIIPVLEIVAGTMRIRFWSPPPTTDIDVRRRRRS